MKVLFIIANIMYRYFYFYYLVTYHIHYPHKVFNTAANGPKCSVIFLTQKDNYFLYKRIFSIFFAITQTWVMAKNWETFWPVGPRLKSAETLAVFANFVSLLWRIKMRLYLINTVNVFFHLWSIRYFSKGNGCTRSLGTIRVICQRYNWSEYSLHFFILFTTFHFGAFDCGGLLIVKI